MIPTTKAVQALDTGLELQSQCRDEGIVKGVTAVVLVNAGAEKQ